MSAMETCEFKIFRTRTMTFQVALEGSIYSFQFVLIYVRLYNGLQDSFD